MGFFTKRKVAKSASGDFDVAVRQLLRKHHPDAVFVDQNDTIRYGGHAINFHNMRLQWAEHQPEDQMPWLEQIIVDFSNLNGSSSTGLNTSKVRAAVRSRATYALQHLAMESHGAGPENIVELLPIAGDLGWCLFVDNPMTMEALNVDRISASGISRGELQKLGEANLAHEPLDGWSAMDGRVFMPVGNDYAASHIFIDGALDALPLVGDKVVFHPFRTLALVTSADDAEGIELAASFVLDQLQQPLPHPVSFSPVVLRSSGWKPLQLDKGHRAYTSWKTLCEVDRQMIYRDQQQLLADKLGEDIFVASYKLVAASDGDPISIATWTKGADSLLPITDLVALTDLVQPLLMVRLDDVQSICGELMEPTSHYPERLRVLDYPSSEQIEQLKQVAVEL